MRVNKTPQIRKRTTVRSFTIQYKGKGPMGKVVNCEVPLSEMFGYATDLRSLTQGRANYTMEFSKYNEAPASIAEGVIKKQ